MPSCRATTPCSRCRGRLGGNRNVGRTHPRRSCGRPSPPRRRHRNDLRRAAAGTVRRQCHHDRHVERVVPNLRTIRQLFRDILSRCEALHIQRIAIPALATCGGSGCDCNRPKPRENHSPHRPIRRSSGQSSSDSVPGRVSRVRQALPADRQQVWHTKTISPAPTASDLGEDTAASDVPVSASPVARGVRAWFACGGARRLNQSTGRKAPSRIGASREPGEAARLAVDRRTTRPLLDGRYVLLEEIGRGGMAVDHRRGISSCDGRSR